MRCVCWNISPALFSFPTTCTSRPRPGSYYSWSASQQSNILSPFRYPVFLSSLRRTRTPPHVCLGSSERTTAAPAPATRPRDRRLEEHPTPERINLLLLSIRDSGSRLGQGTFTLCVTIFL